MWSMTNKALVGKTFKELARRSPGERSFAASFCASSRAREQEMPITLTTAS